VWTALIQIDWQKSNKPQDTLVLTDKRYLCSATW